MSSQDAALQQPNLGYILEQQFGDDWETNEETLAIVNEQFADVDFENLTPDALDALANETASDFGISLEVTNDCDCVNFERLVWLQDKYTVSQLKKIAKSQSISGYSSMREIKLISVIDWKRLEESAKEIAQENS